MTGVDPTHAQRVSTARDQSPAALLYGPGLVIVHGNVPFRAEFGEGFLGLPAVEALPDLPTAAFDLMKLVFQNGTPLARWIAVRGDTWRLTAAPRRDIETNAVYGIAIHLVARDRQSDSSAP